MCWLLYWMQDRYGIHAHTIAISLLRSQHALHARMHVGGSSVRLHQFRKQIPSFTLWHVCVLVYGNEYVDVCVCVCVCGVYVRACGRAGGRVRVLMRACSGAGGHARIWSRARASDGAWKKHLAKQAWPRFTLWPPNNDPLLPDLLPQRI